MNKSVEKNNLLELKNINLTIDGNKILAYVSSENNWIIQNMSIWQNIFFKMF
jgi:hypothetical protein